MFEKKKYSSGISEFRVVTANNYGARCLVVSGSYIAASRVIPHREGGCGGHALGAMPCSGGKHEHD